MSREPDPINDPELFDSLELGGIRSPGTVKISGHDFVVDWDIKEAKGQSGATTTMKGTKLARFTAVFYLANEEQIALWPAFYDLLHSTIFPKPKALDVYHPDLAVQGISSAVLETMGGVVHDGKGGQSITVKMIEYKPPKPKGGSPSGSKKSATAPDPNAALKAELAALTVQYRNTAWG